MVKNLAVFSVDRAVNKRSVHRLVSSLKNDLNFKILSLHINFISSDELLAINKKYLGHNYPTDVISFNYADNSDMDGEILISIQDAKLNAKKYKTTYPDELKRLVIHGILHLLSYNDKKPKEKILMKEMEKKLIYRNKFSLLAGR